MLAEDYWLIETGVNMQQKSKLIIKFFFILYLFSSLLLTNPNGSVLAQEPTPTPEEEPRIVGGGPASPGDWPWQVALIRSNADVINYPNDFYYKQFCGGSILTDYWIITAAHCVTEDDGTQTLAGSIDIVVGLYDLETPASGYQRIDVSQIIRHPLYNTNNLDNDIALIRLSTPITLGGSGETATAIVNLPSSSIGSLTGINAWVTGWGRIDPPFLYDTELYEVEVPIISNATCSLYWGGITAGNLCAGNGDGRDSCFGDSGGPLVINQNGQWILVGIVSSGSGDCGDYPGIYTRISYYREWIDTHLIPVQTSNIKILDSNPTNSASVSFLATFNKAVTGVNTSDFSITTTGSIAGASVSSVSGSGNFYTVVLNTGSGDGTIRLNVIDDDTILDPYFIPLGGFGVGNGNFALGETYTIDRSGPTSTLR